MQVPPSSAGKLILHFIHLIQLRVVDIIIFKDYYNLQVIQVTLLEGLPRTASDLNPI